MIMAVGLQFQRSVEINCRKVQVTVKQTITRQNAIWDCIYTIELEYIVNGLLWQRFALSTDF